MTHQSFLLLHNVSKKKNFGELIRTAGALGVAEIIVVGAQKLASHGAHGATGFVRFSHFDKFPDAVHYLKNVQKATLCGVEICETAKRVQDHPFRGTTAFLMGNEGQGLTDAQMAACDQFVYIPQHSDATASLNVNAACAVVLHHFALWASLPEAPREGYKYKQGPPPQSTPHSGMGIKQMRTLNADGSVAPRKRQAAEEGGAEEGGGDFDAGAELQLEAEAGEASEAAAAKPGGSGGS